VSDRKNMLFPEIAGVAEKSSPSPNFITDGLEKDVPTAYTNTPALRVTA
jgi:hypothetical protein